MISSLIVLYRYLQGIRCKAFGDIRRITSNMGNKLREKFCNKFNRRFKGQGMRGSIEDGERRKKG